MRQRRLMNQINVVPYIDVMLVLLVIFMVTAPLIQTGSVDVPTVGKSNQAPSAPLEVIIHADTTMSLRNRNDKGALEVSVTKGDLPARLKEARAKDPQQPVLIAADKSVRYEAVLDVMDQLQRAQITKIGLQVQRPK